MMESGGGKYDFVEFVRDLGATFPNGASGDTDPKGSTHNGKGNGKGNAGSQIPGSLFSRFTLEESKEVKGVEFFNPTLDSLLLVGIRNGLFLHAFFIVGPNFGRGRSSSNHVHVKPIKLKARFHLLHLQIHFQESICRHKGRNTLSSVPKFDRIGNLNHTPFSLLHRPQCHIPTRNHRRISHRHLFAVAGGKGSFRFIIRECRASVLDRGNLTSTHCLSISLFHNGFANSFLQRNHLRFRRIEMGITGIATAATFETETTTIVLGRRSEGVHHLQVPHDGPQQAAADPQHSNHPVFELERKPLLV
mmetsp:Transcript_4557/g.8113  ORF Transcript_4557/g.8113 Transcript_4557/m.8113 type:complete len:305 (+) Transcript_4557:318-1232(+)